MTGRLKSCERAIALLGVALLAIGAAPVPIPRDSFEHFSPRDRVIVLAPHPDDETLCCAGLIRRALEDQAQVSIVWVTSGDGSAFDAWLSGPWPPKPRDYLRLGQRRMTEARAAATFLGVKRERQYFLGFPDSSLACLLNQALPAASCASRTKVATVPYANAWRRNAPYSALGLESTLDAVLSSIQPTLVLAPCGNDRHPDHAALGRVAPKLVARVPGAALACWVVHAKDSKWPRPRAYSPQSPLLPPKGSAALQWQSVQLTESERAAKLQALLLYASQRRTMEKFLLSFVRANELVAFERPES